MDLQELGAALRAEREKRHLSIDDVASELKINPRVLTALEDGDAQALPHAAYVRGFIRSYASLLGFSSDEIQGWLSDLQSGATGRPKRAPIGDGGALELDAPNEPGKKGAGFKAFIALLILGATAAGAYWAWQTGRLPFFEPKRERMTALDLPGADTYEPERQRPKPAELAQEPQPAPAFVDGRQRAPERPQAVERRDASAPANVAPEAAALQAQEPGAGARGADARAEPEAAAAQDGLPEPHKLIITAVEECWVHSTSDKTETRQFSLRKGDTFALTFANVLELKLGNAGGVRLRYDGDDLPPPGTSGQVKTMTFPPKDN